VQVDSYRRAYAGLLPQEYLDRFSYSEQESDWRELLRGAIEDVVLVSVDEQDQVIGYALGRPGMSDIPAYDSELVSLHVRQEQQRQGIGRALSAAMAGALHQRGCQSLNLWVLEENWQALSVERQTSYFHVNLL
jgi:ribosomal protein S18 acetylase RimI-like enzyme